MHTFRIMWVESYGYFGLHHRTKGLLIEARNPIDARNQIYEGYSPDYIISVVEVN